MATRGVTRAQAPPTCKKRDSSIPLENDPVLLCPQQDDTIVRYCMGCMRYGNNGKKSLVWEKHPRNSQVRSHFNNAHHDMIHFSRSQTLNALLAPGKLGNLLNTESQFRDLGPMRLNHLDPLLSALRDAQQEVQASAAALDSQPAHDGSNAADACGGGGGSQHSTPSATVNGAEPALSPTSSVGSQADSDAVLDTQSIGGSFLPPWTPSSFSVASGPRESAAADGESLAEPTSLEMFNGSGVVDQGTLNEQIVGRPDIHSAFDLSTEMPLADTIDDHQGDASNDGRSGSTASTGSADEDYAGHFISDLLPVLGLGDLENMFSPEALAAVSKFGSVVSLSSTNMEAHPPPISEEEWLLGMGSGHSDRVPSDERRHDKRPLASGGLGNPRTKLPCV
jgi:hypothetical protein